MDNFSLASSSWDEKEYEAIQSVITSGKFSMGEKSFGSSIFILQKK